MYNFLVTAQDGAWASSFYTYDKSRFLEFTNEEIASAFQNLTAESIETLKSYPCLFAYEGKYNDVSVGRLTSIKSRERSILIEFTLDPAFRKIPFSAIKPITSLLDIRDWEMSRTHWAIKDEDLFSRLHIAGLVSQKTLITHDKLDANQELPSITDTAPKISTVQDFIGKVLEKSYAADVEVFYRGHSDRKRYKLTPSLFRQDEKGNYLYKDHEHILYRELLVSNSADFGSDVYTLDRLVRMQHYSLPTRLLDITSNPLIALYFACKSKADEDGEVIVFSVKRENVKYFDSDTASCIANLARLPNSVKDKISFSDKEFNDQGAVQRLIHFIREEKSFFENRIIPEDLRKILCVKGKKTNDRISSQSGAFLMFGIDAIFDENGTSEIQVIRVAITNKAKILRELDLLNINESTVFPYIENSARHVAEKYAFKSI